VFDGNGEQIWRSVVPKKEMKFASQLSSPPSEGSQSSGSAREADPTSLTSKHRIHILVVDDHPVVRKGLQSCLSIRSNILVVGEASTGQEAIDKVHSLRPDLILMDLEMPGMNGLTATAAIAKEFPTIKVLILSRYTDAEHLVQAIQAGARGFAPKNLSSEQLIRAIEIVHQGEPFFPNRAEAVEATTKISKASVELFDREKQVLVYLATGYSNREIAHLLGISIRTVESHRARLMKKVNIHTIAGLTRYALANRLISLNPSIALPTSSSHKQSLSSQSTT
jgi:two-component system nitrate/nitrite response regulator NarL